MEAITNRRSVRQFQKAEMTKEEVEKITLAAMSAPSAVNMYPVHYFVLQAPEALQKYAEMHPYAKFASDASMVFITCIEPEKSFKQAGNPELWAIQDGAAATMNAITAGKMLGWDSVWTGIYPNPPLTEAFVKAFNIPQGIKPISGIVFGKAVNPAQTVNKFKADKLHHDTW